MKNKNYEFRNKNKGQKRGETVKTIIYKLIYGSGFVKVKYTFLISLVFAPAFTLIEKLNGWMNDNEQYVSLIFGVIFVDWLLGTIKYATISKKPFSFLENIKGTTLKATIVISFMYVFEGVGFFTNNYDFISGISESTLRLSLFLYPVRSIAISTFALSGGKFPPKTIMSNLEKIESEN